MKMKGAIRWNLKVIMDRCQIGTVQLSAFLGVGQGTVSKWRQAEFLPEINEKRYIQIYNAINELCDINGTPNRKIKLADLLEFCEDEMRDFELLEYQYASGDARKKPKSDGQNKNDDGKNGIAA
jgi:hypothetical protein